MQNSFVSDNNMIFGKDDDDDGVSDVDDDDDHALIMCKKPSTASCKMVRNIDGRPKLPTTLNCCSVSSSTTTTAVGLSNKLIRNNANCLLVLRFVSMTSMLGLSLSCRRHCFVFVIMFSLMGIGLLVATLVLSWLRWTNTYNSKDVFTD